MIGDVLASGGAEAEAMRIVAERLHESVPSTHTTTNITLFDYGVGNLHSIRKALERAGAEVTVTKNGHDLLDAEAIVLPGVGAFGACMEPLTDVRAELLDKLRAGTPCLAICIGMHLLCRSSVEDAGVEGIGLFDADVQRFTSASGKVPHMGWNEVGPVPLAEGVAPAIGSTKWRHLLPLPGEHVYYVHSYYVPSANADVIQSTTYGAPFAATMAKHQTVAVQFHPEKSSHVGLRLIERWVRSVNRIQNPPTTPS